MPEGYLHLLWRRIPTGRRRPLSNRTMLIETSQVLKNITWTIDPGDRWHLQGANGACARLWTCSLLTVSLLGSGKTTLLSLILGQHPRSFSLPTSSLILFGKPRRQVPTPIIRSLIGHTSPEIYASFPLGMGLTAAEAVGSGFEGIFSRRQLSQPQKERVTYLLDYFLILLSSFSKSGKSESKSEEDDVAKRLFAHFTPPQQALLLFLRAIVSRPKLLILDEPSQGMDEVIWAQCRKLMEKEWKEMPDQAVIVVSHYDDEVRFSPLFRDLHAANMSSGAMVTAARASHTAYRGTGHDCSIIAIRVDTPYSVTPLSRSPRQYSAASSENDLLCIYIVDYPLSEQGTFFYRWRCTSEYVWLLCSCIFTLPRGLGFLGGC